ncbi:MAG: class I SAM-dependent methyltransferase [Burkholderiales bacterium]
MLLVRRVTRRLRRELAFVGRRLKSPPLPRHADGRMLVHIGCGEIDSPEFINVDAQPYPHVHYVRNDITDLSMFEARSVDLIYMCHVLEHVHRKEIFDVLAEFRRVLKPGGVLRISVPDFDRILTMYESTGRDPDGIMSPLLGSHYNAYDIHYWVFTERSLSAILLKAGFSAVRQWDPGRCDHHDFEDWAARSVERDGKLFFVSLNLEAVR